MDTSILAKIKSLLALAENNSNVNEAAAAALKARDLMRQYDIAQKEVDEVVSKDNRPAANVGEQVAPKESYHKWEIYLAMYMVDFLPVEFLIRGGAQGKRRPLFIGHEVDVMVVIEMYEYIRKAIWRMARELEGSRAQRSFCEGAIYTIRQRILERKAKEQQEPTPEIQKYEMICVDKKTQVQNWITKKYPKLKQTNLRGTRDIDGDAFRQGMRRGHEISLNLQLKG